MKLYALNMIQPVGEKPPPDALEKMRSDLMNIRLDLEASEAWVFGKPLHGPEASTVVRAKDGEFVATDGPWTDGTEFIGGLVIIQVDDLDAALEIAARYTQVTGLPMEVRPFQGEH